MRKKVIGFRSSSTFGRLSCNDRKPTKNPLFLPPKDSHVTYLSISHPPHHDDRLIHTRCSSFALLSFLCVGVFFFGIGLLWILSLCGVTGAPPVGPSVLKNNRLINSLGIGIIYENHRKPMAQGGNQRMQIGGNSEGCPLNSALFGARVSYDMTPGYPKLMGLGRRRSDSSLKYGQFFLVHSGIP